jgi:hypothetical protein
MPADEEGDPGEMTMKKGWVLMVKLSANREVIH